MQRLRILGAALLAVFAFGVIAAAAQAEGPFYSKCGAKEKEKCTKYDRLAEKETAAVTVSGGPWTLATAAQTVVCTSVRAAAGAVLIGSNAGTAGSSEEVLIFEGCSVKGNGETCKVENGTITTEKIINTLDKENKVAVKGEKLLVSFRPAKGTVFTKIAFTGGCNVASTPVELQKASTKLGVAGLADLERKCNAAELVEAEKDPVLAEICASGHAPIKLLVNEELGKKGLISFTKNLVTKGFVEEKGTVSEVTEGLAAFLKNVVAFTGHANIELTGVEDWGVFGA